MYHRLNKLSGQRKKGRGRNFAKYTRLTGTNRVTELHHLPKSAPYNFGVDSIWWASIKDTVDEDIRGRLNEDGWMQYPDAPAGWGLSGGEEGSISRRDGGRENERQDED